MAFNLCTQYSIRPEVCEIFGRISGTGAILGPVAAPGFTVSHSPNSGIYVVQLIQRFAEYLGVSGGVTSSGAATTTAALQGPGFAWNQSLAQLTISVQSMNIATPAYTAASDASITEIDFDIAFCDSRVA